MPSSDLPVYDCLVLSGGGAKGAYGAGAAKALWAYRLLKGVKRELCIVGASAGALNAAVLVSKDADSLVRLWCSMTNRAVLGVRIKNAKFQGTKRWLGGLLGSRPYHVYSNAALSKLIRKQTDFAKLGSGHLIVAATNYTEGSLRAFYHSAILGQIIEKDQELPIAERRLSHFKPLTAENFHECLLASAAIPIFFPPVEIGASAYIDGGIGNNTPTREAAYFLRHVEKHNLGRAGEVYVVMLEPPRPREDGTGNRSLLGIVDRTFSIYHYIHTKPIIDAWSRINAEVKAHDERVNRFIDWVRSQEWGASVTEPLCERVEESLRQIGMSTSRIDIPMYVVGPAQPLGDTLDFDPGSIERSIKAGYLEMLAKLHEIGKLDYAELASLQNARVFGEGEAYAS